MVINSEIVRPGSLFIIEHSGNRDFSALPGFFERREYGRVNFSLFRIPSPDTDTD